MRKAPTTYVVYPGVDIPADAQIGEFVLLGVLPTSHKGKKLRTRIGKGAVLRSHTVIYAGNTIGKRFQTGHGVMIRESNRIGDDVSVGTHSIVEHHAEIARGVRIHSGVFIPEYSVLDEEAWIGPAVVFTNARYPQSPSAKLNLKGPRVMRRAKVGAGSVLLPGVVIGRNALVGAGSVVTVDVPDNKVVVGNPARVIKDIRELTEYADLLERKS